MGIIAWIIIGLVAGWLAGQIMNGSGYGLVGDLVLGLVGSTGRGTQRLLGIDRRGDDRRHRAHLHREGTPRQGGGARLRPLRVLASAPFF